MTNKEKMVSGSPEDLIINGSFNRMIDHEAIHFDDMHGRFKIKNRVDKVCSLSGEKTAYFLTQNALQRKGWIVSNNNVANIDEGTLAPAIVSQNTRVKSSSMMGKPHKRLVSNRSRVRSKSKRGFSSGRVTARSAMRAASV